MVQCTFSGSVSEASRARNRPLEGVRGALGEVLGESGGVLWGDVLRRGATWCDEACPDDVWRRLEGAGSPRLRGRQRGSRGLLFLPGRRGIKLECSPPLWSPWVHVGGVMHVMGVYCETAYQTRPTSRTGKPDQTDQTTPNQTRKPDQTRLDQTDQPDKKTRPDQTRPDGPAGPENQTRPDQTRPTTKPDQIRPTRPD